MPEVADLTAAQVAAKVAAVDDYFLNEQQRLQFNERRTTLHLTKPHRREVEFCRRYPLREAIWALCKNHRHASQVSMAFVNAGFPHWGDGLSWGDFKNMIAQTHRYAAAQTEAWEPLPDSANPLLIGLICAAACALIVYASLHGIGTHG